MEQVYSTEGIAERERLAYWREEVSLPLAGLTFEPRDRFSFKARFRVRPAVAPAIECENSAASLVRGKSLMPRAPDAYHLMLHLGGRGVYRQGGTQVDAEPGRMVLIDGGLPFSLDMDRHLIRCWTLSRAVVERASLRQAGGLRSLSSGCGLGFILAAHLDALWRECGEIAPETLDRLVGQLCELVAIAFSDPSAVSDAHASPLLDAARARIEERFREPDLSPADVAACLGISVRSLDRAFEAAETHFALHLRRRRLVECRRLLAATDLPVTEIAYSSGFRDLSTFHRAFRTHFGMTPRDMRRHMAREWHEDG